MGFERYPGCSRADLAVALARVSGALLDAGASVSANPVNYADDLNRLLEEPPAGYVTHTAPDRSTLTLPRTTEPAAGGDNWSILLAALREQGAELPDDAKAVDVLMLFEDTCAIEKSAGSGEHA